MEKRKMSVILLPRSILREHKRTNAFGPALHTDANA